MSRDLGEKRFRGLLGLFVMSGAAGLVDQVCFSKYLSYVVGATAYAVSAVLAAFMTGLALGAAAGGRLSSRIRRPLAAYGAAEWIVGGAVALTPLAFAALTPLYVSAARSAQGSLATLSVLRWGLAMAIVVLPTAAMGATLPLLSPALAPAGHADAESLRKRRLGALYAANTLGGALGALGGAYLVLPTLGLSHTLYASALTSVLAGCAALYMSRGAPDAAVVSPATAPHTTSPPPKALAHHWPSVLSFASGYLCFSVEVVATHLLAVIIGNSAYAFGLILASFLASLFMGAALAPRLSRRLPKTALATSLSLTALAMAVTLPLWDELPLAFAGLGTHVTSFEGREAMRALVAFAILVLPATAMGLTFPLLLRQAAERADVGAVIGRLTAINTLGAVTGALLTGYVVLPKLGSEWTLVATVGVFALLGLATTLLSRTEAPTEGSQGSPRLSFLLTSLVLLIAAAAPRWDLSQLTIGSNVYFDRQKVPEKVLTVREDVHGGLTSVTLRYDVHTLYTNGKFQGNDGWELHAQRYFAHYPCLFVPAFGKALVIGLGTGTTLGTLTAYPWKTIDVLEISPSIVEAAERFFSGPNRNALHDPRVHLTLDDARNHLLVHQGRYDFIGMELSSVWFAGASSLYSAEFYRLVKTHLEPDGIVQQWVQMHHIYPAVLGTLVNTLRREFEHVALFYGGGQGILIASQRPLRWSVDRARRFTEEFRAAPGILPNERDLDTLTSDILVTGEGLDRFIESAARARNLPPSALVSTDDNLYLEYETPRGNVLPWPAREALVETLRTYTDAGAVAAMAVTAESTLSR